MSSSPRLVHIVPAVSNEASGPSYSVVRLCESLIARDALVTLAALDWAKQGSDLPFLKTFRVASGPRRLGRSPQMKRWLHEQAEAGSVDLLHNHSLWMMPNVYPAPVARRHGIPLLVSPRGTLSNWAMRHGTPLKRAFWPLVQRPALDATTCFHATALSEYEDIRRLGFRQPICIIPNGVDIPSFEEPLHGSTQTLLFLGRIHPKKGLDVLLRAWGAVSPRFPGWNLRIAGPDNEGYLDRMRAMATELRLMRVDFVGPIYGQAKFEAYRAAQLFVLPTHSENFGLTVAEALASGAPAIVTKGAPWGGLVSHGAGWWIDIGVEPLVSCLETALQLSPQALRSMGARGRQWMQNEYSWTEVARKTSETYRWLLEGSSLATKPDWVGLD